MGSSSIAIVVTLFSTFVVYLVVGAIRSQRKLKNFKGPWFAGYSQLWLIWQSLHKRVHIAQAEALKKYGSPARIGPNLLVTDDPELLRHMSAPRSKWTRASWYDGMKMDPRQNNIFSERDEKLHAEMRAKMIGAYSGKEVETLESDIDENLLKLLNLVKQHSEGKKVIDMARFVQYFTLDILSQIAFGSRFGYIDANEDLYDYNKTSAEFLPILELILIFPPIRAIIQSRLAQALLAPKGTDAVGQGRVIGIAQKAVAERYGADAKQKKDMLGHFVKKGLSQTQAEAEAHLQIMAGSDSTATVLRVTFMMLVANPSAYRKLSAEIDEAIATGKLSRPVTQFSEATQLPYLQACIWEGLRIWPPLFGLQAKLAPPEGETVNGVFYPGGTEICICDSAVGRRKDIFGDDAEFYRPDRWIEADEATKSKYQRTTEVIFGTGRFVCLGKNIAMMELNKAIVELLYNFDWAIVDPIRGVDTIGHGIHIQENMNLYAWPRTH